MSARGSTAATAGVQRPPSGAMPRSLAQAVVRLEGDERLERPASGLDRLARRLIPSRGVAEGLRGSWTGHALHPLLTDFPLGA